MTRSLLDLRAVPVRIAEIEADPRYQSGLRKAATVFENAPLALIQLEFEQEIATLKQYALPLRAHCRALRAVLTVLVNTTPTKHSDAAAVLAQATDEAKPA